MAQKKTIELKFSDDEFQSSVNCNDESSPTDNDVKILNFGGLIIEVKESKKTQVKSPTIHLNFGESDENKPPEDKNTILNKKKEPKAQETCQNKSDSFVIVTKQKTKPSIPAIPKKPEHLRSNPVKPKRVIAHPTEVDQIVVNGAAGLWSQAEPKVEAPPVTDEDWKIFKQFMAPEPPPEIPCYEKLREMNKVKLNKNREEFVCSLCEEYIHKGKGVVLKNCLHNFCRLCLIDVILKKHDDMGQVKCPLTLETCENHLDDEEVKDLLGDSHPDFLMKIYEKLKEKLDEKEREEEAAKHATLPAMLNADNFDCIENFEAFECKICLTEIAINDGIILKNCLHTFCKECLIDHVRLSEDFIVKCPDDGDDGSCSFTIQEREIRKLVPADVFEKHLEKSLKQYQGASETAFHCKTPDCRGFVEVDENVRGFTCEVCDKVNCIGCKAIHQGMNCQEYEFKINPNGVHQRANAESEIAIKNMIAVGDAMFCPKCGIPVIKVDGCDFITCTTCRLGICWRTKKPRQPIRKANGEFIDGCHCRENGVPCHPQCGNCH